MLIKTTDKWLAAHALINTWLKDKTLYCGSCDEVYNEKTFPCCEEPILETNYGHTQAIVSAIKDQQKNHFNDYASNKKKNIRSTVKLPKRLYSLLNNYYKGLGQKLFENKEEIRKFARKFKMFQVPIKM